MMLIRILVTEDVYFSTVKATPNEISVNVNIVLRRFLHNIATEGSPKPGYALLLCRMTLSVL